MKSEIFPKANSSASRPGIAFQSQDIRMKQHKDFQERGNATTTRLTRVERRKLISFDIKRAGKLAYDLSVYGNVSVSFFMG